MNVKGKRIWRVIVTVTDQPEGDEDYVTKEYIKTQLEKNPNAGVEIKVVDVKDMGVL